METTVEFNSFEPRDHISSFVQDAVAQSLAKFSSWRDYKANVILGLVSTRPDTQHHVFECELLVDGKEINRPVVVRRQNTDLYEAIKNCIKVSEKMLRRASKIRESTTRKSSLRQLEESFSKVA